ncbi:DUF4885 family protein [Metabacillus fastidiosus]|uniref:DUF4885 family protein n=1 Tax=Metabacillus fastidiosus TaxID=1458 RepID=UPI000823FC20|nr:DUF4885 family protein [Metabacillus fastidiosus]MED4462542.1 DUF4885 family protein [Metabacillus fastidiosus]
MKINNQTISYSAVTTSQQPVTNNETTIQRNNPYEGEGDRRNKILDEKYRKLNEENKRYANPYDHILDKYCNPYSPKFRSDLTKAERDAAYSMESSMLRNGVINSYDFSDAAFRGEGPINDTLENTKKKVFNRQQVNGQIQDLFTKYGVTIPLGTALTFTINPNNFKLTVTGTTDSSLIDQLQNVLNTANNSKELFFHMINSSSNESTQFTQSKLEKFRLVNQIKTITGYDLNSLALVNNKFITEDGTDIFDIYKEKLSQNPYTKDHVGAAIGYYGPILHELAKNGFDSIPDLTLSIRYEDGQLHDIGQSINYSKAI